MAVNMIRDAWSEDCYWYLKLQMGPALLRCGGCSWRSWPKLMPKGTDAALMHTAASKDLRTLVANFATGLAPNVVSALLARPLASLDACRIILPSHTHDRSTDPRLSNRNAAYFFE
ncbi:hypothetical protein PAAG_11389 [Paracoccidioides lutzii Pb01]|uniref:Uncharacterized protein n=1 Tax=Paracoccidioides lutzii (strain ATCC MYA-826 / Pb01) TaxID=502779 RepID=A0A0A2V203_PARBA|nr:hypothetical protein PAAG_11389 [Paracoccidioides lutzii Pb01]KGQ01816.1 hypothetical protein PAAG_11389 [Paracoccidioides lutzii Pb01]